MQRFSQCTHSPVSGVQLSIQRFNLEQELGLQEVRTPPIATYVSSTTRRI